MPSFSIVQVGVGATVVESPDAVMSADVELGSSYLASAAPSGPGLTGDAAHAVTVVVELPAMVVIC